MKICAKFLGKVTREKQVRRKEKHLSIIMRIIKEKTSMDNINQKSLL